MFCNQEVVRCCTSWSKKIEIFYTKFHFIFWNFKNNSLHYLKKKIGNRTWWQITKSAVAPRNNDFFPKKSLLFLKITNPKSVTGYTYCIQFPPESRRGKGAGGAGRLITTDRYRKYVPKPGEIRRRKRSRHVRGNDDGRDYASEVCCCWSLPEPNLRRPRAGETRCVCPPS